jgi:hypothetical protein
MTRFYEVKSEWEAAVKKKDDTKLKSLAEYVRSKPVGAGYIEIFLPKGQQKTSATIMNAINAGDFYAVSTHHLGTPVPEVVSAKVAKDNQHNWAYMVELGANAQDTSCVAVTNHGRIVPLRQTRNKVTASVATVCGSTTPDKFHCAYIRIQCKRPAKQNPRYQWDFNYVYTQPYFLSNFDELTEHFTDKEVADFKEAVTNNPTEFAKVKASFDKADQEARKAQDMAAASQRCKKQTCDAAEKEAIALWERTPVYEDHLGDDADTELA